ncbi:MAG TPA: hypothetical protein PL143_02330 [Rhodocyclaceae bacterium]|nr:hypothetical protein [Rhodocyclaceae bacterium]
MNTPGRSCPLRYRYGAGAIARAPERAAETLYVVGGLYGNLPALDAIEALAAAEHEAVTVCFNGDFNWFDVDDAGFRAVNERVRAHDAIAGNVEAELATGDAGHGCGCAYPDGVEQSLVDRSNRIHARLRACASRHADILAWLATLPMVARYRVGGVRIGVVHGDAESLAGWRFDAAALDRPGGRDWLAMACDIAGVEVFASTHTCLPALRQLRDPTRAGLVINNGAAGMPNFRATRHGVITRISVTPSPHPALYGARIGTTHCDALAVHYDHAAWQAQFGANWPPGSDAWRSYQRRIAHGPDWGIADALGRSVPAACEESRT